MFGLGIISSLLGSGGPSKEEKKLQEQKSKETENQREEAERALDARRREFANEAGDPVIEKEKETKPKVREKLRACGYFRGS